MKRNRAHDPSGKRHAILAAATDLFVQQGYEKTSIAEIAKEANVAVGSVYRQFPDKIALLSMLHFELEKHLIETMEAAWDCGLPYRDRFKPMFAALLSALTSRHAILPLMAMTKELAGQENYKPGQAMIEAIARMYEEGIRAGELRPYPMQFLPSILHGMVNGGLSAWAENPTRLNEKKIAITLKDLAQAISRV
jgi:AcrR family transcriptional regulator